MCMRRSSSYVIIPLLLSTQHILSGVVYQGIDDRDIQHNKAIIDFTKDFWKEHALKFTPSSFGNSEAFFLRFSINVYKNF